MELVQPISSARVFSKHQRKKSLGTSLFAQKLPPNKPNQVKEKMAPTNTPIAGPAPSLLRMNAGGGSAAGAVALATSAEKKRGEKGLEMKISSNFDRFPRRGPSRLAKLDVSEPEVAGGTRETHHARRRPSGGRRTPQGVHQDGRHRPKP